MVTLAGCRRDRHMDKVNEENPGVIGNAAIDNGKDCTMYTVLIHDSLRFTSYCGDILSLSRYDTYVVLFGLDELKNRSEDFAGVEHE
ncbi:hypothetical protein Y032_0035g3107 [Ancylostoma ceylanicum]|uniref:Uncharacterized protein n=1 Tax=Ancylostoma ceylanicum TaxID=53326 RepID=A0A016ULK9_9BILA|nr:hypothetical protein Y032_0035g3107 [Ancylostoma ceylanicum]